MNKIALHIGTLVIMGVAFFGTVSISSDDNTLAHNNTLEISMAQAWADQCGSISNHDLRYYCQGNYGSISNNDLRYYGQGSCGSISNNDLRYYCQGSYGSISNNDLRYYGQGSCGSISNNDLRYLCYSGRKYPGAF